MICVYILRCSDGTLYTGWTTDIDKRLIAHNSPKSKTKYTRARQPVTLVYQQECADKSSALKREWEIKKMTRKEKESLIDDQV